MKKPVIFLVLMICLSMLIFDVSAAEIDHPHSGSHCVCGGSAVGVHDHSCADITWTALPTSTTDLGKLASGNYYLTADLTVSACSTLTGKQLNLCLNGYSIDTTASAVFGYLQKATYLSICDCSGRQAADGSWSWGGTVTANRTGGARMYGGITNVNANSRLNIYGGNYVGATGGKATNGGVFNVCNDYYSLVGGTSNSDPALDTRLNIYNGHITGGDVATGGGVINAWHSVHVGIYGGTLVGGTGSNCGSIKLNSNTNLVIRNALITDSNPATVLIMDGDTCVKQCTTLATAVSNVKTGQRLRLTGDVNESVTLTDDLLIDLAGNDLSGVTLKGAHFMDSATDGYNSALAGKLTPASGTPVLHTRDGHSAKRYLALEENGSYSFLRFYMGITKLTLKPGTAGLGYKATFVADEQLKNTATAYGFSIWLDENRKITKSVPTGSFSGEKELTLRIDHFLSEQLTDEENELRAGTPVYACAYMKFADGTVAESATVSYSLRQMLELANDQYEAYSATQQNALQQLGSKYSGAMICWDVDQFHHAEGGVWQAVTASEFIGMLTKTTYKGTTVYSVPEGTYLLTEDVDIGSKGLIILAGAKVNLCLNGHTLTGSVRMIRNFGTLNICDCHDPQEEGTVLGTLSVDTATKKNYASVLYTYYNSVTNLHGGNLKATGTLTSGGVVAISHDGDESDPTQIPAVFNMYGGTVSGGWVSGSGGNIVVWNNSSFNMYGGTIHDGSAASGGGISTSDGTVNIYGGTIRDCEARSGNGGNIFISAGGTLTLQGGNITGGTATVATVDGVEQPATGQGGGVYIRGSDLPVSGDVCVVDNNGSDLYIGQQSVLKVGELSATARIGVDGDIHGKLSNDPDHTGCFVSNSENFKVAAVNGCTALIPTAVDVTAVNSQESIFRVGYSITDITPTESGLVMSSYGNPKGRKTDGTVNYPLNATVVAISDQANNTILMITVDLQNPPETLQADVTERISQVTGIPAGNIYITATHTHNVPTPGTSSEGNKRYQYLYIDALVQGALTAMADRAPASMSIGSFDTDGMNYSRHYYYYLNNDPANGKTYYGDQFGLGPQNGEKIYRVRQGDETMHMMAFERTDKQPILLVNWRAHPHRSGGKYKYTVDADVIGATREYMHANTEYLFAYYQGAAGNMNTTSRISGETYKSGKITEYGNELGRQIVNGMANLSQVDTGLIQTKKINFAANVDHTQDDKYEQAVALTTYYKNNPTEMDTLEEQLAVSATYGFTSVSHASRLIAKYKLPETRTIELNVFSIGEHIGFYTAPAELWDSFSEELETLSPFDVTFCIGYCNGGVAYIPYELDYEDSYEDVYCLFTQPETITQMKELFLENLDTQYALATDDTVLTQRRDAVEAKMRSMCSVIWRAGESITYTNAAGNDIEIVEGRLYQGLPYTSGGNGEHTFLSYASSTDEQGNYVISDINKVLLHGSSSTTRLGNDCSSAVMNAWGVVSDSFTATATQNMVVDNGCLRVGTYESDSTINKDTKLTTAANGEQTMFTAYAQLQKADALVHNNGNNAGHAIMVVSVHVVKNGTEIDPDASYVTIMEQTSSNHRSEVTYYDEELGENVYVICGVDKKLTFRKLYDTGYLPITCLELIDPTPIGEAAVTDSEATYSTDNMFTGTFTANRTINAVTVTITDSYGNTVQALTVYNLRGAWNQFSLKRLLTEAPAQVRGSLDLSLLEKGNYTCTYSCLLATGQTLTAREFDFIV